ncbi:MAG: PAS domain-containing sensor histidine kinase [Alphaproteobacteria bacterium]|nr:PAS domain-containing sensor histidine kinase [Alphaproteobacteria bacterium]
MNLFAFGLRPPHDEADRFLLSQQVILARQQLLAVGLVSTGIALLIVATFAGMAPWPVLAAWCALAVFGLAVTRSALRLRRKKSAPSDPYRSARRLLSRFVTISALWGAAFWFTMPSGHVELEFLLIFLAAGSAAGLVSGFGPIPNLWAPMIVLTVAPPAIRQCLHAGRVDLVTCIGLALFVAALFFFGGNAFRSFLQLIRLQRTTYDLTTQKTRIETELEHFFERTNALTAVADPDGSLRRLNPMWERLFGYDMASMLGKKTIDFVHPNDREATQLAAMRTLEGQPIVNHVNRFRAADGSYRWLQWNAVRNPYDGTIIATAADITDREDARVVKEQLIATVSHELRTPLTALQAALQILSAGIGGSIPGPGERMLRIAERNTERLISLTNDILDLERIPGAKGDFDIRPIDPEALVRGAVEEMLPMSDSFGVDVLIDDHSGGHFLLGDEEKVRQVLHNLLSNAVKFSPLKGTVRIGIIDAGTAVRINVADDGPGIPPGAEEKVFDRFVQLPRPADRKIGGSGLGLSIARDLIAAMNGRIGTEPSAKGARFFFELPRAPKVAPPDIAADGTNTEPLAR